MNVLLSDQKTTVDWLRFRAQAEPRDVLEALRPMFGTLGSALTLKGLPRGILGFQQACSIQVDDLIVGRMDHGGDSQRGWVRIDLPGKGCEWVQDWTAMDRVEQMPSAQIRRLDIALTTWDGEITHEQVVAAHAAGRFCTRGRPPNLRQITSSDPRAGRTCYVGERENTKFLRCYEKGLEMAAKIPFFGGDVREIDGKRVEDIYRVELELKAADTDIPWEVLDRRDEFFAGAYPFCADVLPNVDADILMRRPSRAPQTDLAAVLKHCQIQYGQALFTALHAYEGDITAVWDKIIGRQHSEPLLEAGVLLVDHR
jgi:phage replication initiation protein